MTTLNRLSENTSLQERTKDIFHNIGTILNRSDFSPESYFLSISL
ncbi:MAG: hypothetical protein JETT_3227 [Candidatus Jettenia ecosi]|uniref:Uncharacterized protein n=1 Tax=Candidatus Jettenia ecosi TaxID=2494326 RepID=A0A533Q7A1_9BACT|nr:MAG: hypothetical protein JETT_3227 [Candidatus Jettenia ecosi]